MAATFGYNALVERLQSVRETAPLLCNKMRISRMGKRYLKASYKKKQGKNKKNKLVLTWFSSYIKLPESITKKKVVINKKKTMMKSVLNRKLERNCFTKRSGTSQSTY